MKFIESKRELVALGDGYMMGAGNLNVFIKRGHSGNDLLVDADFDGGKVLVQNSLTGLLTGVAINGAVVWLDAPELRFDLRFNEKEEEDE